MSANLRNYTKALYGFDATMARTDAAAWSNQSPCEKWKAIDVVAHNVGMNDMVAGFTRGVDASRPTHDTDIDPMAEWDRSFAGLLDALDQKGALQTVAKTPWGTMPVEKFLGFAWVDPVVHTWDLAKATGQPVIVDAAQVERAAAQLEKAGDSLVGEGRFQPAVQLSDGAAIIDRFIALTGRDPQAG